MAYKNRTIYVVAVDMPERDGCGNRIEPPSAGQVRDAVLNIIPLGSVVCGKTNPDIVNIPEEL